MPKPFKIKTVHGKKIKRLTGSSKLKLEKRAEQKRLIASGDLKGLMDRYEALEIKGKTAILIGQDAFEKEGPMVLRPWADSVLKGKINHYNIAYMEKNELAILSRHYSIPLRILERIQRKERQKEVKKFSVKTTGESIQVEVIRPESSFVARIPRERKLSAKPFDKYSNKDLERLHEENGMPLWLLRMLRERERKKISKARQFIKKI